MARRSRKKSAARSPLSVILSAVLVVVLFVLSQVFGIDLNSLLGTGGTGTVIAPTQRPGSTPRPATPGPAPTVGNFRIEYPRMPTKNRLQQATVDRVVDGDTLDVMVGNEKLRLRLIGLNTPETVDPRRPVECFGREASNRAKELLPRNMRVFLEADSTQDNVDRNGRYLRFLWTEDGRLFNMQMIAEGFAYEYTYDNPYKYQAQFRQAQRDAQRELRGLWAPNTCNGQK